MPHSGFSKIWHGTRRLRLDSLHPFSRQGAFKMPVELTRRDVLQGLVAAGVALEFSGLSVMAQGEEVVPFTDLPAPTPPAAGAPPAPPRFDPRNLQNFIVSNDDYFAVQHYGIPAAIDPAAYKLRITGHVDKPSI